MNVRQQWLWQTLKDLPGVDPAILRDLLHARPEIGRTDDVIRAMHYPRRNGLDVRCTPNDAPTYQFVRI